MTRLSIPLSQGGIDVRLDDGLEATPAMVSAWRAVGEKVLSELDCEAAAQAAGQVIVECDVAAVVERRSS